MLLARHRVERLQLLVLATDHLLVGTRCLQRRLGLGQSCPGVLHRAPGLAHRIHAGGVGGEAIEHGAMTGLVHQRALVVLAVDLDHAAPQLTQQADADRAVVDVRPAAPVAAHHPAEHELRILGQVVLARQRQRRVFGLKRERGGDRTSLGAPTHQSRVTAGAQRQAQCIEKNRFAGAGLAGQHAQALAEFEIQALNDDNISDRKPDQHVGAARRWR